MTIRSVSLEEKHEEMLEKLCEHENRKSKSNMIQTLILRAYQNIKVYIGDK